jgi:hypothetical protein
LESNDALARLRLWIMASAGLFRKEPAQPEDWTPDSPGWQALLRFASLVPEIAGPPSVDGLLKVTRLRLAAFLFVDNVYYLTNPWRRAAGRPSGASALPCLLR